MSWNNIIPASMLEDVLEKPKRKRPDATIAMLKIQQALVDMPDATYIKVMGYRKYNDDPQVTFERGLPPVYPTDRKLEYKKWVITEWYIPANSAVQILKTEPVATLGIDMPDKSFMDVVVRDSKSREIAIQTKNHILDLLSSMYKIHFNDYHRKHRNRKAKVISLTEKNWKVINTEPDFVKMIQLDGLKPRGKYYAQSAFKKKANVNNTSTGFGNNKQSG